MNCVSNVSLFFNEGSMKLTGSDERSMIFVKKRMILSGIGAVGAGVSYVLKDKDKRDKLMNKAKDIKQQFTNKSNSNSNMPIEEAGKPELDQEENAKMVSEGSQFGVNYYNEVKEQENEKMSETEKATTE